MRVFTKYLQIRIVMVSKIIYNTK